MTKLPIQNQGFRLDLNLEESFDDDAAWDNLYNPGISADLSILRNNLRNTSILGSPSISISLTTDDTNNTNYGVNGTTTIAPHFFTFNTIQADGSIGAITDSTFTNDDVVQFNETITFNIGDESGNGSGTVGSLDTQTFYSGQNYYVCNSNARNRFKISTTRSTDSAGISTVPIISVNDGTNHQSETHQHGSFTSTFGFIRNDGVTAPNLNSFIIPEILDDNFSYLYDNGINGSFSNNLSIYEYTEIVAEKKYRTNKSLLSDRDIKYEGSVRVKDPGNYNSGTTQLGAKNEDGTPNTPGIFIGNTRAFSTDNNPWSKSRNLIIWQNGVIVETMTFATESHADEFTIGDLEFGGETNASGEITGGEIKIKGLNIDGSEIQDISSSDSKLINLLKNTPRNVYKFPMIINDETFYILVEREQADNLT